MFRTGTPQDKWVFAGGLNLHYIDWGNEEKQPVLLLHGLQDCASRWDFFAERMASDYRVLALDHRGHGDSPKGDHVSYTLKDYVTELAEIIDSLELKDLILIGHSAGAKNAYMYASQHSERLAGLVIVDMDPDSANPGSASMFERYKKESDVWNNLNDVIERLRVMAPNASNKTLRHHAIVLTKDRKDGSREWKRDRGVVNRYERPDAWAALYTIWCPTLLIRGSESPLLTEDIAVRMRESISNCYLEEIPSSGHWCHDENPEAFYGAVLRFLENINKGF